MQPLIKSYIYGSIIGPEDTQAKLLDISNNEINCNTEDCPVLQIILLYSYLLSWVIDILVPSVRVGGQTHRHTTRKQTYVATQPRGQFSENPTMCE